MTLHSLTYMSSAVHVPSQAEIDHLLARARVRNAREHVTGVLLHSEGSFLQCIEGPTEGVERVFSAIVADPLHHNVLELMHDEIGQRAFANWTMAYRDTGRVVVDIDEALTRALSGPAGNLSVVHHLLGSFWNGGLGNRYHSVMNRLPTVRRHEQDSLDTWKIADFAATDSEALLRIGFIKYAEGIGKAPTSAEVRSSGELRDASNVCLVTAIDVIGARMAASLAKPA